MSTETESELSKFPLYFEKSDLRRKLRAQNNPIKFYWMREYFNYMISVVLA